MNGPGDGGQAGTATNRRCRRHQGRWPRRRTAGRPNLLRAGLLRRQRRRLRRRPADGPS